MELRCPDCASPEVVPDPDGSADERRCGNCGSRFLRESCLVAVAEAESEAALQICAPRNSEALGCFRFDAERCRNELRDPDGDLWPVNAFSDADEVHSLVSTALDVEVISHGSSQAGLHVYALALTEPDPLLAVDAGGHPTILGHSLRLRERERENPVDFTVRLLGELVAEANHLLAGLGSCRRAAAK